VSIQTTTRLTTLPRVNLLPPEIGERKRLQQVQAVVVLCLVLAVAGVAYFYIQGRHDVATAKQQLAAETTKNAQLTQQVATADDGVTAATAQLTAKTAMLAQATNTSIDWAGYLADLSTLPEGTWLTSLSLTSSLSPGSVADVKSAPATVGSISVQGVSLQWSTDTAQQKVELANFADWLDGWQAVGGTENVWFSNAATGFIDDTGVVNFQGTVDLTSGALAACTEAGSCSK